MGKKGGEWPACGFVHVCCDYGVCVHEMKDELGVEAPVEKCAEWMSGHLIDAQKPVECRGCAWE